MRKKKTTVLKNKLLKEISGMTKASYQLSWPLSNEIILPTTFRKNEREDGNEELRTSIILPTAFRKTEQREDDLNLIREEHNGGTTMRRPR